MARLQLLLPLFMWALWLGYRAAPVVEPATGTGIYVLSLGLVVVLMRRLARRAMDRTTIRSVQTTARFHQAMFVARWLLLALHAAALFWLGWGQAVLGSGITFAGAVEAPAALLSMLPVVVAWVGLAWSQYPLDRAVREQNIIHAFTSDEAYFEPPTLGQYVAHAARLQVLSLIVPIAALLLLRDALHLLLASWGYGGTPEADAASMLLAAGITYLIGPEILRLVFPVRPLPASPLRERLQALCDRLGLRYREILLWDTHHTLCNAAVMGLIPRFRYIMLSDLLLETMDERQIEAVFAHEAGHVMHRHLAWIVVFVVVFFICMSAVEALLIDAVFHHQLADVVPIEVVTAVVGLGAFFLVFGSLSRSFERQADLFAARSVVPREAGRVDPEGVAVFNSALQRVAQLNNMPLDARSSRSRGLFKRLLAALAHHAGTWRHGSIRARMDYLQSLPQDPERSLAFDRRMAFLRIALLAALCSTTAWAITTMAR